jgi:hypothetical protein
MEVMIMAYKIRATYKMTGKRVWASTAKFKTKAEAKEYAELVVGKKRFSNFNYIKLKK